jgi:uncharacterized protein (TIGR02679 family)
MNDPLIAELRSAACQRLLARLVARLQRGEALTGTIRLKNLTAAERATVREITGSQSRGDSIAVDLAAFDAIVRNTGRFASLAELVRETAGPVANRPAERSARAAEWARVWDEATQQAASDAALASAIDQLRRSGWLAKAARRDPIIATDLLRRAMGVLRQLPVEPIPLAIFAAQQLGDAHALDSTATLGRLALRLLAARDGSPPPLRVAERRRMWEHVGIVTDELSTSVLVANLPAVGGSLSDQMLRQHHSAGMPCRLTFRHLRLHPPTFQGPTSFGQSPAPLLYVCENPSVIAAATERQGANCRPIVCLEGNPNLACWRLLSQLTSAGFRLAYHGDFDWGGLRIANRIYRQFGFVPWRFTAADHRLTSPSHRPLRPPECQADWDCELSPAIAASGVAVEEESLIEELVQDLYDDPRGGCDSAAMS